MSGFSTESLINGIEACKKNIKTFEDAIERERATIKEYRDMIEVVENKPEPVIINIVPEIED